MLKILKLWLAMLMLAVPLHAAELNDFDPIDANNIARWPEGMAFASVNDAARADEGILARFWKDVNGSLSTTGAANVYAVSANQTLTAYYTGLWIRAKANFTNSGSATINFDALGAKTLKKESGATDLAAGDIVSGGIYDFVYDGTNVQVLQLNPALITTAKIADGAVTTAKIADLNVTWGKLAADIFNQSAVAPATGDKIPFADVSDVNAKKVATIADILSLGGAGFKGIQAFTASGTYTPTAGTARVIVISTGAGGGGAGSDTTGTANTTSSGAGGGSGGTCIETLTAATIGASQTVTVGTGGTAGANTGGTGGTGGSTTFGALHTASGGTGGVGTGTSSAFSAVTVGGDAGTCTGGDINISGGEGAPGDSSGGGSNITGQFPGNGAASFWGGGARGVFMRATSVNDQAGRNGTAFGSGGSGASSFESITGAAGGIGANGAVIVLEFGT